MKMSDKLATQIGKLDDSKMKGKVLNRHQRRKHAAGEAKILGAGKISVTPCDFPEPPAEVCHVL